MKYAAILISLCLAAAAQPPGFEGTLAQVAAYEVGDSRAALVRLEQLVTAALAQPEEVRRMEQAMLKALEGKATLSGKDRICRQLSLMGSAAATPVLAKMLAVEETADMARYALERIPGPAVDQALRAMLPKAAGRTLIGIVNTLGRRRDVAAVAALRALIPGSSPEAALAAAHALGQIGGPGAAGALSAVRPRTSGPLRMEVDDARLQCAEQMNASGDRKSAFAVFRQLSAPAEPEMIRVAALGGLAASGGADAIPLLSAALRAAEPPVRRQAIRQLSVIPGPGVVKLLGEAAAGMDPGDKLLVISALADRGDQSAAGVVSAATRDAIPAVRIAALQALEKIGNATSVDLLAVAAASEAGDAERGAARLSLARLPGRDVDGAIIAGMAAGESKVRLELITAAAERGSADAAPALLQAATDANREVRRAALRALRTTAAPPHIPGLLALLAQNQTASERAEIGRALAAVLRSPGAPALAPVITAYQASQDTGLKAALLAALAQTGNEEALPVLRGALKDADSDLRRGAILALTEWPNSKPLPDLLDLARSAPDAAAQVLALRGYIRLVGLPEGRPPAETVRLLADALRLARQADEKKAVLSQLALLSAPEALALAETALNDPDVAGEAKLAVDRIRQRLAPRTPRQP